MKTNFLLFFFFLSLSATAQLLEPNAIKIGAGVGSHSLEKVAAPAISLMYNKDFFPKSIIELNATILTPVDVSTEEETRELISYQFGMNMLFKILETREQAFNAGFGFSAGYYKTNWTKLDAGEMGETSQFSPGFSAVVTYDFILPSQWLFGVRANFSRYDMDRGGWILNGVVGYRF